MKRIFLIILDSFGIGELPDAYKFGDEGSNTLRSVYSSEHLDLPNMTNSACIILMAWRSEIRVKIYC